MHRTILGAAARPPFAVHRLSADNRPRRSTTLAGPAPRDNLRWPPARSRAGVAQSVERQPSKSESAERGALLVNFPHESPVSTPIRLSKPQRLIRIRASNW